MNNETIRFGTDGIRGHAERFPFTTPATQKLGYAIGSWAAGKYQSPVALIGSDTRSSCAPIKQALCAGLGAAGVQCVDASVLPTPAVLSLIRQDPGLHMGIMISASHNPHHDNGIKLFDRTTGKITRADEAVIEENFAKASVAQKSNALPESTTSQHELYTQNILSHFPQNLLQGHTIVLDCANGATYDIAPQIFRALGATVVTLAAQPNGTNINENCGALHPAPLQEAVLKHSALVGFAFDGDGDRVIAVNSDGDLYDGDDILCLLLDHPACKGSDKVVGTVMTNHGFDAHVAGRGMQLVRTKVGDKNIAAELARTQQVLGGETSGHIIMTD